MGVSRGGEKETVYSMWMLYNQYYNLIYLLASCYVDGSIHSARRSGETQDQDHINDTPSALFFLP